MALKDFKIRREEMQFQGGSVSVRGLALNDVTHLIANHLAEIDRLFGLYDKEETRETAIAQSAHFVVDIIKNAPDLAAKMIVCGCDEADDPEALEVAKRLSLPTQTEMLRKIFELTFEEAGGLKKWIDSLAGTIRAIRPASLLEG